MERFGTAAILAGGQSRRMGFDKQKIKINDEQLIDNLYNQLKAVFERVIIISNSPELYAGSSREAFPDLLRDAGPLGGIHRALFESRTKYVFMMACDMTRIDVNLINLMMQRLESDDCEGSVAQLGEWIEPFHGFYSVNLLSEIERLIAEKDYKIAHCLERFKVDRIPENVVRTFTPDWGLFRNLNSKTDLEAYRRLVDEKMGEH